MLIKLSGPSDNEKDKTIVCNELMSLQSHLLLLHSFLTTPSVGVKPEKLFLALLVTHDLL